jgi:CHAD domain-containing protein
VPLDGTTVPARFHRVEVEVAANGDAALLEPFVAACARSVTLAPTTVSKFEAAMHARGLVPAPTAELGSSAIDASMTTGAVALASLRRSFAALLMHEPGTRLGDDPEALHDMRVAIRRLRAMLALFADALPPRAAGYRATLGWIADALGGVRDLDVQLERLEGWRTQMEADDADALATVAEVLRGRRVAARRRMLRVLDCARYDRFIQRFAAMLRGPTPRRGIARRPIVDSARTSVRTRMRKVRKRGDGIVPTSPPVAYHRLRIDCKKLRYALEAHADVYGKPARRLASSVTALQDLLGCHQDAEVAISDLRAFCERRTPRLSRRAIFVIGKIAERYEREARRLRRRFLKLYQAATGGRWKKMRRLLEKRASDAGVTSTVPATVAALALPSEPPDEAHAADAVTEAKPDAHGDAVRDAEGGGCLEGARAPRRRPPAPIARPPQRAAR